ncbi:tRNA (adenosine(37)-N6)-threonylcarbamoyltransferase complex ATPase subunit type 1 TsaE [Corynebacterium sp.]|jgi:tRNA threonylcarbamoyladenosine biosynthesis protein TsaE|uniref:tRNA (adenosine(37)-N6)-threonylcarbamoyltransferase complex ATPase subunit type 1 TsaE n=1 Tax=Corynebacterium sp. TaxID=1720 RepID=UPI0025B8CD2E|nr:tRNA (adenosine(37)-N6)-threonylcarbamoyltransferase complex ATPase subunit type 1 TsaE [Corynebacterium sp.]
MGVDVTADFTAPSGTVPASSAEAMRQFGEQLGAVLQAGDVVVLTGPLGAGKTTFTQGLVRGLGAKGRVQSPTFTIIREHKAGSRPDGTPGVGLLHMDAYRLLGDAVHTAVSEEGADIPREAVLDILESLDVDDDLGDRVLVAEWGRGVVETLSTRVIDVEIVRDEGAEETDALADDDEPRDLLWTWIDRGKTH